MFLCTTVNSALTTTIMGNLKNLLSVFLGLFILEPPEITLTNFLGLSLNAGKYIQQLSCSLNFQLEEFGILLSNIRNSLTHENKFCLLKKI